MKQTRSESREAAMKCLYKIDILKSAHIEYDLALIIKEECEIENNFVEELIKGVLENLSKLDEIANDYLANWEIKRLNKVDQAIFRIGIYELKYTKTPCIVAINEAIELSKKYSDEEVSKMLNGMLDTIYHSEDCSNE